ncbi:MAG: hypothetical protein KJ550_11925 [Proteobacteria bacterium]|nr:hypothetical protein [Desulfobacteraceae bacterium]MBU2521132.1 hypothetical protein [Pseudomonadota bacterium]MBU3981564.1 hypothetical protein [Pseudomonadota bacterium]MBU4014158.1 hypothetical protein [Pseudomonadota bacterium]MBU4067690.1 hypothetical protein [Pseudomonadota bacterium]
MPLNLEQIIPNQDKYLSFLQRLRTIWEDMGKKYQEAADYYGFFCNGCEDNCCYTRFYHHTLLEYLFIRQGYSTLEHEIQNRVSERAIEVCAETIEYDKAGKTVRLLCPLNFDGLCILYEYRPMICRLHGIPHQLQRPGQGIMYSPGCEAFEKQCEGKKYIKFDRTPFYVEMANLERELREVAGFTQKFKMTVAQMLIS